ncbi:MAG: hypothetical protein EU532_01480 [Promethearchaeota archaeon]|nr:MAG: hypothetical protein EU532_01480 [Candidatus Lokiarchaeota archaeon]
MPSDLLKIENIITFAAFFENIDLYGHLFEVQTPPEGVNLFKVRYNFDMGTPLVGDLILDLENERMLEVHPFPEWVVYLRSSYKVNSKPYLVVPNFPKTLVNKMLRKSVDERINVIQQQIDTIQIQDLLAFEYKIGVNVLVPAFIPHFFISSKINKEAGEKPPYLQVFEPNLDLLTKNLKIKTTYFFKLPFSVSI